MLLDFDACYRAVRSRDARFDGRFYTAVRSTGVYCRPSCPAQTPLGRNVRFYRHAAAAERAGFRACRRCRPDVGPQAPEWDVRADLVGRALRLIADGVVDSEGVDGLARRLSVGRRHLHRLFVAEVGVGPLAVARTNRAHLARRLLDDTSLPVARVAFAAGFSSVRQFNATVRAVYGRTPTGLRAPDRPAAPRRLALRLAFRAPLRVDDLLDFLRRRALPGVEHVDGACYRRTIRTAGGGGVLELEPVGDDDVVWLRLRSEDPRALAPAAQRSRRLLDLEADTGVIEGALSDDPLLAPLVACRPGLRLPGAFDGFEQAVRAVVGQQVSVQAATAVAGRLVAALGEPLTSPVGELTHLFPLPGRVADADLDGLGMPRRRAETIRGLAAAVRDGEVVLDGSVDPDEASAALLALPGVGPWTVASIRMRALRDPDALPAGDLGLRRALADDRGAATPARVRARAQRWRPWRGYAAMHLWADLSGSRGEDRR
ncbi:MAG: helix-turn-helix domain-containing protein [Actinobacteria bacterium]|nr:helix-turn-helix domain-containing protein [Actinomycetota bacterium]